MEVGSAILGPTLSRRFRRTGFWRALIDVWRWISFGHEGNAQGHVGGEPKPTWAFKNEIFRIRHSLFANTVSSECLTGYAVREYRIGVKGQDVVVILRLANTGPAKSYADLGKAVGLSASEAHAAVRRLVEARLLDADQTHVHRHSLLKFLVNGVPFAFPACMKEASRGTPTGWGAPVFEGRFASNELPPVWPDPEGEVRGQAVKPLYESVVSAAKRDPKLYDLLALVDALRLGRAREREIAETELEKRLLPPNP